MNILFICTGNTCRSPMAEGLMRKIAQDYRLDISVESAGIFAQSGEPASRYAIEAMAEYGVDISAHKAKQVTEELLKKSDIVLTMTQSHKEMLFSIAESVYTLNEYANVDGDIPDPYGGSLEEYKETAARIYDMLLKIAKDVKQ
ncbi:MAG: low molecular weight protein arginine phosphatase [Clostridia bacterium]|nr:low molecular weight protein arginine phosphatase [Clostridia bacterium]